MIFENCEIIIVQLDKKFAYVIYDAKVKLGDNLYHSSDYEFDSIANANAEAKKWINENLKNINNGS